MKTIIFSQKINILDSQPVSYRIRFMACISFLIFVQLGLGLKLNTKIQIHPPTHHPHRNSSEGCRPSRRLRINMQAYPRLRN